MIEIKFHLAEFMDGDPVTGCPVTATVQVAPRFFRPETGYQAGRRPRTLFGGPG